MTVSPATPWHLFNNPLQPINGAVSVTIDNGTKTIDIRAKIGFWSRQANSPLLAPAQGLIDRVLAGIYHYWDNVNYACYTTNVVITAVACNDFESVPPGFIDVELDQGTEWFRSNTGHAPRPSPVPRDRLSDDPSHLLTPGRGDTWRYTSWRADASAQVFAHEFGHILGLDDGYFIEDDGVTKGVVAGHTCDLMAQEGPVSMAMITRVLRRHGQDVSSITCPLTAHGGPSSIFAFIANIDAMTIDARCDKAELPSDDPTQQPPPMKFTGTLSFSAGYLSGPNLAGARDVLGRILGVDTSALANDQKMVYPISFELPPVTPADSCGVWGTHFTIPFGDGGWFDGWYFWDMPAGVPYVPEPLLLCHVSTKGLFPGGPMYLHFMYPGTGPR